ncbi:MAG: hypothetical protein AAFR35_06025 [Pseudomonadota bacterium]
MILTELTSVPTAVLPVAEFRDHLRLGSGFADDALQDAVLDTCLRAAISAIEARLGKALITRSFLWSLAAWRDLGRQVLPVAPVDAVSEVKIVDQSGSESVVDSSAYRLIKDTHRPVLAATSLILPTIPVGGAAEIQFTAGYGTAWSDLPADLARAVFLLAAHYYEHRHEVASDGTVMPWGVSVLIERYRQVRIFGGGRR